MLTFKCVHCGELITFPVENLNCGGSYHPDGEELLWGHLQFSHPDIFESEQTLETPEMIECHFIPNIE